MKMITAKAVALAVVLRLEDLLVGVDHHKLGGAGLAGARLIGPPAVIAQAVPNIWNAVIEVSTVAGRIAGRISGSVMLDQLPHQLAPSISAAS